MLCLAPIELVTDAERQLHRVLSGFGAGSGVIGGLAVFVPVVDGAMQRRQADAIAFLPETILVIRAVGMGRQTGELRPSSAGVWTVGGEVLRLSGGGSHPSTQLQRAVELIEHTLTEGGLDPGYLPTLAIIEGAITSVRDRSAGGPIACRMDSGDVLTGLRHGAAAGLGQDRLVWTTADVKAALTIFGLQGRGPSVEELNNEGFLYSPYVLRRAGAVRPPLGDGPSTDAGRYWSAAIAPRQGASAPPPAPLPAAVPTVASLPPVPAALGAGPFSGDYPTPPPRQDPHPLAHLSAQPASAGHPAPASPAPPPPEGPPTGPEPAAEGGLAALLDHPHSDRVDSRRRRRSSTRATVWIVAAVLLVLAGVGGVLFAVGSGLRDPQAGTAASSSRLPSTATTAPTTTAATTAAPPSQVVDGTTYTLQAVKADSDCAPNSYGQVADFFSGTPCSGLTRSLFTADLGGVPAVISVSVVQMPDEATAGQLQNLADTNGTGNVSDLLRAGVRIDGGPPELVAAAYASARDGSAVRIVEVAWLSDTATGDAALLASAANDALRLAIPEP